MIQANYGDRTLVVNILTSSFVDNRSVNYLIKQDNKRVLRIQRLMEYSFDICLLFGKAFLSNDKKGCALIILPDKGKVTFRSIILDLKLIFLSVGLSNIMKAISREAKIRQFQPEGLKYYLWFIGVDPKSQGKGTGTVLLRELIEDSEAEKRTICLETSTARNIPWYQRAGFTIYNELDFVYKLFLLRRR